MSKRFIFLCAQRNALKALRFSFERKFAELLGRVTFNCTYFPRSTLTTTQWNIVSNILNWFFLIVSKLKDNNWSLLSIYINNFTHFDLSNSINNKNIRIFFSKTNMVDVDPVEPTSTQRITRCRSVGTDTGSNVSKNITYISFIWNIQFDENKFQIYLMKQMKGQ